jgi:hypothetical protein
VNHDGYVLPRSVQERIHLLSRSAREIHKKHALPAKPASFGVYLGMINSPATEEEAQILSQWDAVILDYCEPGVLDAVNDDTIPLGPHILARLDLLQILSFKAANTELDQSRVVYVIDHSTDPAATESAEILHRRCRRRLAGTAFDTATQRDRQTSRCIWPRCIPRSWAS